jgi:hypothetical protein
MILRNAAARGYRIKPLGHSSAPHGMNQVIEAKLNTVYDCGFDLVSEMSCTGLTGMRERAQAIGGNLWIDSTPGQGTKIAAELPLPTSTIPEVQCDDQNSNRG